MTDDSRVEFRRDADAIRVQPTSEQRQRTIDAATADMLAALEEIGRRLDAMLARLEAKQKERYFAELEAHLDRRCTRADFFDADGGGFGT